jgi:hypothetical protein
MRTAARSVTSIPSQPIREAKMEKDVPAIFDRLQAMCPKIACRNPVHLHVGNIRYEWLLLVILLVLLIRILWMEMGH